MILMDRFIYLPFIKPNPADKKEFNRSKSFKGGLGNWYQKKSHVKVIVSPEGIKYQFRNLTEFPNFEDDNLVVYYDLPFLFHMYVGDDSKLRRKWLEERDRTNESLREFRARVKKK